MTTVAPYTVRAYLTADLVSGGRVPHLVSLARIVVGQPLEDTVAEVRDIVAAGVGLEDFWRLHILISQLSHGCAADLDLTTELRAEVHAALATRHEPADPATAERG